MTICGPELLTYAPFISVIDVYLSPGSMWRPVTAFEFTVLAENNHIWAKKKKGILSRAYLQNITPDEALSLIEKKRAVAMVRGRIETTASKTTYLESPGDGIAPIHQFWKWNRFKPAYRGRPDLAGPKHTEHAESNDGSRSGYWNTAKA